MSKAAYSMLKLTQSFIANIQYVPIIYLHDLIPFKGQLIVDTDTVSLIQDTSVYAVYSGNLFTKPRIYFALGLFHLYL